MGSELAASTSKFHAACSFNTRICFKPTLISQINERVDTIVCDCNITGMKDLMIDIINAAGGHIRRPASVTVTQRARGAIMYPQINSVANRTTIQSA